jgi:Fe-S-cluster containining protein
MAYNDGCLIPRFLIQGLEIMRESSIPKGHDNKPLVRESFFSYTCNRCSRCCYDKQIQVNPYEVARLARHKGITTTELIASYLEPGKPYLNNKADDGACVFLTPQGCGVHVDRPLVCRIYPLEQKLTGEGKESFRHAKPHPETAGVYGLEGTVAEFLRAQGVIPFLEIRDQYLAIVYRLLDILAHDIEHDEENFEITKQTFGDEDSIQQALSEWLDMDRVISNHCHHAKIPEPGELEERLQLHLHIMDNWITTQTTGGHYESSI